MAIDDVLTRLDKPRRTQPGRYVARCPAHKDRRASLSLRELDDGRVLVHCFAGCEVEAILAAVGLELEALFPPRPPAGGGHPAVQRPFSARELLDALAVELRVAWVVLSDVAAGKDLTAADRKRAGLARARCEALVEELRLVR